MLSVSLLGEFQIRQEGAPLRGLDTARLQSLLAYLILHRDAPQSRAHVAFLFWPDTTDAQAHTNLRNLLHHLRRALPNAESYLDASMQTLQWRSDAPLSLDVADFEAALAQAEHAEKGSSPAAICEALERAIALYKGDLLPSCYDDWIIPQRERLRKAYLSALERLVRMLEDQRDYEAAIRTAERLLQHDPLHEATYLRLMRLHALNGDRATALRVYHTCATVLKRELDVEPSAATREVYQQLLGAESRPSPTAPPTTAFSPLVGREREWAQMLRAWRAVAAGGESHVVILRGEAGIGKTRLVEELLQWAARQGIACAGARCYAAEGELAYAPVTAWLRARPLAALEDIWLVEVARLLPEVLAQRPDLPRPPALSEAWQRQHLFEALSRAILGTNQPLLLSIDDLQWCDRDTLEWLHFLLRFDRQTRLLIVGTYRPEEVGEDHALFSTLQALRLAGQVTEIDLPPLDEGATRALATLVAGRGISTETAQLLYRETEGNPLFVIETMRAGLPITEQQLGAGAAQSTPHDTVPSGMGLPPKVQSVLQARLAQLSPPTRELVALAATIGREFGFTLLAKASGRDEETLVRELDELWQRRIVREHGIDAYNFTHDKLREVAYHALSAARRRLLHLRVARALEALHATELDPVSHQLARHYERAGLARQAASYYLRAATVARQVYANEEAIALLRRGLLLVEAPSDQAGHELAVQLCEALGDVLELKAQHEEAVQAYREAQARVAPAERIWQARLYRKAGVAIREQRRYAQALDAFQRAEIALGEPPVADDPLWWEEWLEVQVERVYAHYWLAEWPEMEALVNKVQPFVQEHGRPASRVRFLLASALLYQRKERYTVSEEMVANLREALTLSQELGDPKRLDCEFELGFLLLWRRELDEAKEHLRAALELAQNWGAVCLQALALTYLTVLSRFRGEVDEVYSYALRTQEAAEAAHMPDYVAATRGNQAWLAWRRQDLQAVEQLSQEALALWRQSPLVYPFRWQALWPLLAVALVRGHEDKAWGCAQALLEPTQQRLPDQLNTALETALQAKAHNQTEAARCHLNGAMERAREMGYL